MERFGGLRQVGVARKKQRRKIKPVMLAQIHEPPINLLAEDRFVFVEIDSHARVLRTATGKEEHDRGFFSLHTTRDDARCILSIKRIGCLASAARNNGTALVKLPATDMECPGHVGEIGLRMFP